ncbi:Tre-2/Bub2/Cdc16 (TBC) - like protein C [Monocercomonoides exilis]|uniref:Tre-2/Bub2/Cdc16 (TBC) - like protein C n=1 Tax=Monocercomonoides exilis TaxID=2049356 RepID=UPI00355A3120|nr:Tre-2/Bub2/Cdc16 (TBC) - like protein C [Monocercomonoides exilis]|eukprot:MONOS_5350.1-p1 / transcript=MONOS_5350.1 / gene=MONOS_5350 / organism=Monocercomonoides_exilis_PA203 / gene_product=Tre-2/Bub2/Cdc16 (TBC) - like protein C / transcript_product=Tre-2/Bub2/Cdc16 (TBC) - like protein C / location=Mono_scaffold00154:80523-84612(+) / protein_length=1347 / sequence_SO=supercontig / SO=protein_coding / is_pseudo=false
MSDSIEYDYKTFSSGPFSSDEIPLFAFPSTNSGIQSSSSSSFHGGTLGEHSVGKSAIDSYHAPAIPHSNLSSTNKYSRFDSLPSKPTYVSQKTVSEDYASDARELSPGSMQEQNAIEKKLTLLDFSAKPTEVRSISQLLGLLETFDPFDGKYRINSDSTLERKERINNLLKSDNWAGTSFCDSYTYAQLNKVPIKIFRRLLRESKSFPAEHRMMIWSRVLMLPLSKTSRDALANNGAHPSLFHLASLNQIADKDVREKWLRVMNMLGWWSACCCDIGEERKECFAKWKEDDKDYIQAEIKEITDFYEQGESEEAEITKTKQESPARNRKRYTFNHSPIHNHTSKLLPEFQYVKASKQNSEGKNVDYAKISLRTGWIGGFVFPFVQLFISAAEDDEENLEDEDRLDVVVLETLMTFLSNPPFSDWLGALPSLKTEAIVHCILLLREWDDELWKHVHDLAIAERELRERERRQKERRQNEGKRIPKNAAYEDEQSEEHWDFFWIWQRVLFSECFRTVGEWGMLMDQIVMSLGEDIDEWMNEETNEELLSRSNAKQQIEWNYSRSERRISSNSTSPFGFSFANSSRRLFRKPPVVCCIAVALCLRLRDAILRTTSISEFQKLMLSDHRIVRDVEETRELIDKVNEIRDNTTPKLTEALWGESEKVTPLCVVDYSESQRSHKSAKDEGKSEQTEMLQYQPFERFNAESVYWELKEREQRKKEAHETLVNQLHLSKVKERDDWGVIEVEKAKYEKKIIEGKRRKAEEERRELEERRMETEQKRMFSYRERKMRDIEKTLKDADEAEEKAEERERRISSYGTQRLNEILQREKQRSKEAHEKEDILDTLQLGRIQRENAEWSAEMNAIVKDAERESNYEKRRHQLSEMTFGRRMDTLEELQRRRKENEDTIIEERQKLRELSNLMRDVERERSRSVVAEAISQAEEEKRRREEVLALEEQLRSQRREQLEEEEEELWAQSMKEKRAALDAELRREEEELSRRRMILVSEAKDALWRVEKERERGMLTASLKRKVMEMETVLAKIAAVGEQRMGREIRRLEKEKVDTALGIDGVRMGMLQNLESEAQLQRVLESQLKQMKVMIALSEQNLIHGGGRSKANDRRRRRMGHAAEGAGREGEYEADDDNGGLEDEDEQFDDDYRKEESTDEEKEEESEETEEEIETAFPSLVSEWIFPLSPSTVGKMEFSAFLKEEERIGEMIAVDETMLEGLEGKEREEAIVSQKKALFEDLKRVAQFNLRQKKREKKRLKRQHKEEKRKAKKAAKKEAKQNRWKRLSAQQHQAAAPSTFGKGGSGANENDEIVYLRHNQDVKSFFASPVPQRDAPTKWKKEEKS